jgi:acyl carrier protein
MQSVADIQSRIVALVQGILEQNSITAEVTPDAKLVDIGLTSVDMVNLMLSIEAEFDFTMPQDEITPENFQSVATLHRLVAKELRAAQAAWRRSRRSGRDCTGMTSAPYFMAFQIRRKTGIALPDKG